MQLLAFFALGNRLLSRRRARTRAPYKLPPRNGHHRCLVINRWYRARRSYCVRFLRRGDRSLQEAKHHRPRPPRLMNPLLNRPGMIRFNSRSSSLNMAAAASADLGACRPGSKEVGGRTGLGKRRREGEIRPGAHFSCAGRARPLMRGAREHMLARGAGSAGPGRTLACYGSSRARACAALLKALFFPALSTAESRREGSGRPKRNGPGSARESGGGGEPRCPINLCHVAPS